MTMTQLDTLAHVHGRARSNRDAVAALRGIGTSVPPLMWRREEIAARLESLWDLNPSQQQRWRRLVERTTIETKHSVVEPEEVMDRSTRDRMKLFEKHAGLLGAAAAENALHDAGIDSQEITDLIVVTCTGFTAPGVDLDIIERLGLKHDVQRTMVGFMGCFGALNGLRVAMDRCAADHGALALVVCVELCSLHLRRDLSMDNLVASALFADGAAAAVVGGSGAVGQLGLLHRGWSRVFPGGREWMSWRITDNGFAMTLSRDIPPALGSCIGELTRADSEMGIKHFLVHPGGPEIISAVEGGIVGGDTIGFECSRDVLRRFGNMSSSTILFVLSEAMQRDCPLPACLLAFGPGLTVEALRLMPCPPELPTIP